MQKWLHCWTKTFCIQNISLAGYILHMPIIILVDTFACDFIRLADKNINLYFLWLSPRFALDPSLKNLPLVPF